MIRHSGVAMIKITSLTEAETETVSETGTEIVTVIVNETMIASGTDIESRAETVRTSRESLVKEGLGGSETMLDVWIRVLDVRIEGRTNGRKTTVTGTAEGIVGFVHIGTETVTKEALVVAPPDAPPPPTFASPVPPPESQMLAVLVEEFVAWTPGLWKSICSKSYEGYRS
jgi:hypothetical protein